MERLDTTTPPPRILIVDDEQHNLHVLGNALRTLGQVHVATSGEQALRRLATPPYPEMILLDVVMPGIDGFAVCQSLKENPATTEIPVIFITAMDAEADETKGFALGAVDFITKPIRPAIVQARVRTHLALQAKKRELRTSGELLHATLESTRDGILAVGHDGRITHCNAHFLRLFPPDSNAEPTTLQEAPLTWIATRLEHPEPFLAKIARLRQARTTDSDLLHFRDGRIVVCYSVPLLLGAEESIAGRVWNFADVTREKHDEAQLHQARREAEAANKAKSAFLATMSHEIRTPLNGILGMAELLMETALDATGNDYVHTIHASGQALLGIINDILDYSKIEAEKVQLESIPFDLHQLVKEVALLFSSLAHKKGIDFVRQVDTTVPVWVDGDPTRLRQVLANLLANAIKFTQRGTVTLAVTASTHDATGTWITCNVQDTGIGIAPEQFARLFKPFEQADDATTRRFGGTGLGLAISQRLVALMRGRIEVESTPGVGTLFRVVVPVQGTLVPQTTHAPQTVDGARGIPSGARILLVDDEPVNRAVLTGMLKKFDLAITCAENGQQAVNLFSQQVFDLIFMDCQMPELDGYAASTAIRRLEQGRRTPIVALTALALPGDRDTCLAAGMDDYLAKPVTRQGVRAALVRWLPATPPPPTTIVTPEPAPDAEPVLDRRIFDDLHAELGADFADVIAGFLESLPQRLQAMRDLLAAPTIDALAREAHKLRGSSSQLGARSLAQCASELEEAARNGHLESTTAWAARLEQEQALLAAALRTALGHRQA